MGYLVVVSWVAILILPWGNNFAEHPIVDYLEHLIYTRVPGNSLLVTTVGSNMKNHNINHGQAQAAIAIRCNTDTHSSEFKTVAGH